MFHLDMISDVYVSTAQLSVNILDQASICIISDLTTLLNVRAEQSAPDNLDQDQLLSLFFLSTDIQFDLQLILCTQYFDISLFLNFSPIIIEVANGDDRKMKSVIIIHLQIHCHRIPEEVTCPIDDLVKSQCSEQDHEKQPEYTENRRNWHWRMAL